MAWKFNKRRNEIMQERASLEFVQDSLEQKYSALSTLLEMQQKLEHMYERTGDKFISLQLQDVQKSIVETIRQLSIAGVSLSGLTERFGSQLLKAKIIKSQQTLAQAESNGTSTHDIMHLYSDSRYADARSGLIDDPIERMIELNAQYAENHRQPVIKTRKGLPISTQRDIMSNAGENLLYFKQIGRQMTEEAITREIKPISEKQLDEKILQELRHFRNKEEQEEIIEAQEAVDKNEGTIQEFIAQQRNFQGDAKRYEELKEQRKQISDALKISQAKLDLAEKEKDVPSYDQARREVLQYTQILNSQDEQLKTLEKDLKKREKALKSRHEDLSELIEYTKKQREMLKQYDDKEKERLQEDPSGIRSEDYARVQQQREEARQMVQQAYDNLVSLSKDAQRKKRGVTLKNVDKSIRELGEQLKQMLGGAILIDEPVQPYDQTSRQQEEQKSEINIELLEQQAEIDPDIEIMSQATASQIKPEDIKVEGSGVSLSDMFKRVQKDNPLLSKSLMYEEIRGQISGKGKQYQLLDYNIPKAKSNQLNVYRANSKSPLVIALDENTDFDKAMQALQTHVIIQYLTKGELYDPIAEYAEKSALILRNTERRLGLPSHETLSRYGLSNAVEQRKKQLV